MPMLAPWKAREQSEFGIESILITLASDRSGNVECGLQMFCRQDGGDIHESIAAGEFVLFRSHPDQHFLPKGWGNALEARSG